MRILVTGASGQLGRSLLRIVQDHDLIAISRPFYDITNEGIIGSIVSLKPDVVIHAAAMTDVDGCERDPESAYLVNVTATKYVATACAKCNSCLAYISTDYVFDGRKVEPYNEDDPPHPLNVYGETKLDGERLVQDLVPHSYIIRTAWLYGEGPNNFVKKILELTNNPPIRIVTTQVGSPTNADDLAIGVQGLIQSSNYGIFHLTNGGSCSRYEMAKKILELSGLENVPVDAISQYQRLATIPPRIVLRNTRAAALGIVLRPWQQALHSYVTSLRNQR